MSAAARLKLHRERQAAGIIVIPVAVHEADLAAALEMRGYLAGCAADDRAALASALARWIERLTDPARRNAFQPEAAARAILRGMEEA